MTEEKQTVTGTVFSVGKWPSGKGYFTNLANDSKDYYYYGGLKANVGEEVVFEVTPGTRMFEGKFQVQRRLREAPQQPAAEQQPEVVKKVIDEEPKPGPAVYMERQESISKLACIKAAAAVVGELCPRNKTMDWKDVAHIVMDMADTFYLRFTGIDDRIDDTEEE